MADRKLLNSINGAKKYGTIHARWDGKGYLLLFPI
jgi:hypothetical protein